MNTKVTSFRFPLELLRQIDRYAVKKTKETGIKWSRIAAMKFLIKNALEQEDVNARRKS